MQTFVRLKLLKEFSEKFLKTKYSEGNAEDLNADIANQNNSVISEQRVELPLENQIYDMIDATGSKGLTLVEVCFQKLNLFVSSDLNSALVFIFLMVVFVCF